MLSVAITCDRSSFQSNQAFLCWQSPAYFGFTTRKKGKFTQGSCGLCVCVCVRVCMVIVDRWRDGCLGLKKKTNKIAPLLVKVYGLLHKPRLHSVFIYKLCFSTEMYICTMWFCFPIFCVCLFHFCSFLRIPFTSWWCLRHKCVVFQTFVCFKKISFFY